MTGRIHPEDQQEQAVTGAEAAPGAWSWRRQTIAETFARIGADPEHPWLAIGDFLDDWRFTDVRERPALVEQPPAPPGDAPALRRWAAFCAAMVEWLCRQDDLPFPHWTASEAFTLDEPWFLYPGDLLKPWQLATTPAPFKARNIFGGDAMLNRY